MLLIHILPFNRDNHPWCADFVAADPVTGRQTARRRVVIKPPPGVCPSPAYAASFDCDCVEAVTARGLGPAAAAAEIAEILRNEEVLLFSGAKAYLMFLDLMTRLLIPGALRGKKISSFRSILRAASAIKNVYPGHADGGCRGIARSLGGADKQYIGSMHAVFADLAAREPRLLDYFANRRIVLDPPEPADRILLGVAETGFYAVAPVKASGGRLFCLDLGGSPGPRVLPSDSTVSYTVSSAITAEISRSLGAGFAAIRDNFAKARELARPGGPGYEGLMREFGEIARGGGSDVLGAPAYRALAAELDLIGERAAGRAGGPDAGLAAGLAAEARGPLKDKMLDYLFLENASVPPGCEALYRETVAARINAARDRLVAELESTAAAAGRNRDRIVLARMENVMRYLSE